ncbi:bile acid:sodium symporter family protein [Salipaludibacillus sp. CUR1]|uniref:bile acid:sodium symporter family protein n=1 Tax=Salipaludibacillus sp. CUR1 TaxID=2820003 RepID=UPI001E5FACE9|nr:bile acid:sodium symporter family protein [Salipaludibacillus sp. CUR1]MCE7792851.1 bile acid:sodium symporter family protein [Salipaludibacillus sp. CUR1]
MMDIDYVLLNFNPASLMVLNIFIGFVMFGVALDLKIEDFKNAFTTPKPMLIGLFAQFFLLPAFTFLLVLMIQPRASIALGLLLIAACPGGNLSNFMTHLAKGNTALSINMSAIATVAAIVMTPLNVMFWGSLLPETSAILRSFTINPLDMLLLIILILGLPLVCGMYVKYRKPEFAAKASQPMKYFSITVFIGFVVVALISNWPYFLEFVGLVILAVFLHNLVALLSGYFFARLFKLREPSRRAIAIEVGIQNSALGLVLIFNFFEGLGGMAVVAAWWGVWHIISGLTIAFFWSRRPPETHDFAVNGGLKI